MCTHYMAYRYAMEINAFFRVLTHEQNIHAALVETHEINHIYDVIHSAHCATPWMWLGAGRTFI